MDISLGLNTVSIEDASGNASYCPQQNKLIHLQCKSGQTSRFGINVSPLFDLPVTLNTLTDENRVIRRNAVSIVFRSIEKDQSEDTAVFDALIVLNTTSIDGEIVVTCDDGIRQKMITITPLTGIYMYILVLLFVAYSRD